MPFCNLCTLTACQNLPDQPYVSSCFLTESDRSNELVFYSSSSLNFSLQKDSGVIGSEGFAEWKISKFALIYRQNLDEVTIFSDAFLGKYGKIR
jgi:hypothetical protein